MGKSKQNYNKSLQSGSQMLISGTVKQNTIITRNAQIIINDNNRTIFQKHCGIAEGINTHTRKKKRDSYNKIIQ